MSVRVIIVLLALPLFLLLAAVNSLLLYREETQDMDAGLRGQALAAAVTVAEFAKASPDPFTDLVQPHRYRALHAGTKDIFGLQSLYLSQPGKPTLNLIDRPIDAPRIGTAPTGPKLLGTWRDSHGRPLITALAPAGKDAMVVADVDAEPLARRTFHLKRLSLSLIAGSAALAILLGLIIARRVVGEFRRTRTIIDAHGSTSADQPLGIREVRDLADAIHLIDASVSSELQRLVTVDKGDPAVGIAAARARHFPDVSETLGGIGLSIRSLPNAPAGSFYLRCPRDGGWLVTIGEVDGEPVQALAGAIALRDHVLAGAAEGFERRLATAGQAFGLKHQLSTLIAPEGEPVALVLNGNPAAAQGYARRLPELDPADLTSDLAMLYPTAGIVVAARSV